MVMTAPHAHAPLPRGIDADAAARLAAPFAVLADPSRLRIVYGLVEGGPMCVSDIAAVAGTGESATSHQLAKLRSAGVVRSERKGREIWYQVADAHIRLLLDVAAEHYLAAGHYLADAARAEPTVAEPGVAESVVAESVVAEPGVAESVVAESVVADPGVAEPGVAEPASPQLGGPPNS